MLKIDDFIMRLKNTVYILGLFALLIFSGCSGIDLSNVDLSNVSEEDINKFIVCNDPYMRHGTGCCLDKDDNNICDSDETTSSNSAGTILPYTQDFYDKEKWAGGDAYVGDDREFVSENEFNEMQVKLVTFMADIYENKLEYQSCSLIKETPEGGIKECKDANQEIRCLAKETPQGLELACEDMNTDTLCAIMLNPAGVLEKECAVHSFPGWEFEFIEDGKDNQGEPEKMKPCTREYKPVCAIAHGEEITFSNKCEMENNYGHFLYEGECKYEDYTYKNEEEHYYHEYNGYEVELEVELEDGKVELDWNEYPYDDFMYYKVMHSDWNSEIKYPDEAAKYVGENQEETSYILDLHGTENYYRITVVLEENRYIHSDIVEIDYEEHDEMKDDYEEAKLECNEEGGVWDMIYLEEGYEDVYTLGDGNYYTCLEIDEVEEEEETSHDEDDSTEDDESTEEDESSDDSHEEASGNETEVSSE